MPELPEVERFRQYLLGTALNQKITQIDLDDPKRMLKVSEEEFRSALIGKAFTKTERIGKYLFAYTDSGPIVIFHFGMTGKFDYFKDLEYQPRFTRVLFYLDSGFKLAFVNMRKFGWVNLTDDVKQYQTKNKLGEDALSISFDKFYEKLKGRKSFVKPRLMEQKILAGIGNWLADDILYQSKIHPETPIENLEERDFRQIYDKMLEVLNTAVDLEANWDRFPAYFMTWRRKEGATCYYTGEPVEKITVGGRTTYFCPQHQVLK